MAKVFVADDCSLVCQGGPENFVGCCLTDPGLGTRPLPGTAVFLLPETFVRLLRRRRVAPVFADRFDGSGARLRD